MWSSQTDQEWEHLLSQLQSIFDDDKRHFFATVQRLHSTRTAKASSSSIPSFLVPKESLVPNAGSVTSSPADIKQILFEFHSNLCKDTHAYQGFDPNFLAKTNAIVASVSDQEVGKSNFKKRPLVEEIGLAIASMSNHKAAGLDKLFNECLKSVEKSISPSLVGLFGCVWSLEAAPSIWAKAVIHLIPKGHDVDMLLPSSYHPISLTSLVSKVFEKVLLGRLDCYAEEAELFPEEQAGFRKGPRSPLEQAYILREILDLRKGMKITITFLCFVDLARGYLASSA
jgi:hypothetical protein